MGQMVRRTGRTLAELSLAAATLIIGAYLVAGRIGLDGLVVLPLAVLPFLFGRYGLGAIVMCTCSDCGTDASSRGRQCESCGNSIGRGRRTLGVLADTSVLTVTTLAAELLVAIALSLRFVRQLPIVGAFAEEWSTAEPGVVVAIAMLTVVSVVGSAALSVPLRFAAAAIGY